MQRTRRFFRGIRVFMRVFMLGLGGLCAQAIGAMANPMLANPILLTERLIQPIAADSGKGVGVGNIGNNSHNSHILLAEEIVGTNDKIVLRAAEDSSAQIRSADLIVKGDTLIYDKNASDIQAVGQVRMLSYSALLTGTGLRYNLKTKQARITYPTYRLADLAYGKGNDAVIFDNNHIRIYQGEYTGCPCDEPFWKIKARQLDLYKDENVGEANNVTFYLKGRPIVSLPYLTFPLSKEKKSGLLVPVLGYSSRSGLDLSVPYFFNLAPNYDATVTPRLMSKRGLLIDGEFRYLTPNFNGIVDAKIVPYDLDKKSLRWLYRFRHRHDLGMIGATKINFATDWGVVSDDDYFRDFSNIGVNEADTTYVERNIKLQFNSKYWSGHAALFKHQTLQDSSNPNNIYGRYERVPEIKLSGSLHNFHGLDLQSQISVTQFVFPTFKPRNLSVFGVRQREAILAREGRSSPDGWRVSTYNSISLPIVRSGWNFTPKLGVHASYYSTNWYSDLGKYAFTSQAGLNKGIGNAHKPKSDILRVLPIVSLDLGFNLERNTTLFGKPSLHTLRPRLYYSYIPYENQDDLPIYDTGYKSLSYHNAFTPNMYNGGWDRINNSNQLTMGLSNTWYDADSGFKRLSLDVAQRFYFDTQKVTLPYESARVGRKSDVLLNAQGALTNTLKFKAALQYDTYERKVAVSSIGLWWNPKRLTSVYAGYHYRREPVFDEKRYASNPFFARSTAYQLAAQETAVLATQWPISSKINAVGRIDYSLRNDRFIQAIAGFQYNANCCWSSSIVFHRYAISKTKSNSAVFLKFELNGLGAVGSSPTSLLRKNIPGYQSGSMPNQVFNTFERYE